MKKFLVLWLGMAVLSLCPRCAPVLRGEDNSADAPLGFRGLNLGLTFQEMQDLVKGTPWKYKTPEPKPGEDVYLVADTSMQGLTWLAIGCAESKDKSDKQNCYWLTHVHVKFYNDKINMIELKSVSFPADKIESELKNWGIFAVKSFTKKYGRPSKIYKSMNDLTISYFKPAMENILYKWERDYERIIICVGQDQTQYFCTIRFDKFAEPKKAKK